MMAALLLLVGGVCLEAAAADRYVTENGIEYRVTEGSPSYLNFAYIVRIDGTNSHVVIPERFTVGGKDCLVKGFDKGAKLTAWFNLFYLTLPDGFEFNEVDLSDFSVDIFTWANKLGPVDKKSKFASYSHYISSIKVFYTSYDSNTLKNAKTWQDMGFACVAPLSLVNGDDGDGYYYSSAFDGGAAVVSELTGSAESITIPKIKKDYSGNSHQVKYFGLPDARITNYAAESLTFEGPITLLGGLDNLTSLKKVSFAGIDDYDDICSLKGKLIRNQNLEEIYFTGNTLPNLRGAATDYVYHPGDVTVYIKQAACSNLENLKTQDVWKAFKDVRYIDGTATYTLNLETYNSRAGVNTVGEFKDGQSYSGTFPVSKKVGIYAYQIHGDYTLTHFFVDGVDVLSQTTPMVANNLTRYYYYLEDGKDHTVRLVGEAQHAVFDKLMVHQSGEGNTTIIATKNNASTQELNVPQGTGYGMLDVPSSDLQQVEVRFYPVNTGKPTVYNGTQQIDPDQVHYYEYYKYYWVKLPLSQLKAGDFTVSYPVSYAQEAGSIKTTISVRNYSLGASYSFSTPGDTQHYGSVANNTTEEVYHKHASGGTYTIYIDVYSQPEFRIRENGVDVTDQAVEGYHSFTYTIQHPDQNGTIVVDDGRDVRMNMMTNAKNAVVFRYTDSQGTHDKTFGKGTATYSLSTKGCTGQELVVTADAGFALYRDGEDISSQYTSSNVCATDATKREYHFAASGEQDVLHFVDGETLNLTVLMAQTIPVTASTNSKDARGIKIETFRYGDDNEIDASTLHTWGNLAVAPIGGVEHLKAYFYHKPDERLKVLYINGKKYTGGYETEYRGNPESTADCFAMNFQGVGSTGYSPSEDYYSLNLEAVFQSEGGLDPTMANATVLMSDESGRAYADMSYYVKPEFSELTKKNESMRKGLKTFAMKKEGQEAYSKFLEYELYVPEGYRAKVYIDGVDYTSVLSYQADGVADPDNIYHDYTRYKLAFSEETTELPNARWENTTWNVVVTKALSEVRTWNVTMLANQEPGLQARASVSFYDEDNANKTYYNRVSCGASSDMTENTTINVPYQAVSAGMTVLFDCGYDDETGQPIYDINDYDLVVKADGRDISRLFTTEGENVYFIRSLDPTLLSASEWMIGYKKKNSTVITHTATLTGDMAGSSVAVQWLGANEQTVDEYQVTPENPRVVKTTSETPQQCRVVVSVPSDRYGLKVSFNGEEMACSAIQEENGNYVYSMVYDELAQTDGSLVFELTKKPSEIIKFADAKVKAICVQYWDTDGDGELSMEEAAAVTTLKVDGGNQYSVFNGNTEITSFDEFQYFTGLRTVGSYTFKNCTNLASIKLPATIKILESDVFTACTHLTRIELPEGLQKIESYAFSQTGIESIYIPKDVETISIFAFSSCNNLASIVVAADNAIYDSRNGCNAIIRKDTNKLSGGCKYTVIPEGITTIDFGAFNNCKELTEIIIPASVTVIKANAFNGCNNLTSVVAKMETPATLGNNAFKRENGAKKCVLTVPAGKRQAYIDAGWTTDIFKGGIVEEPAVGDVNSDGWVNVTDIMAIANIILGITPEPQNSRATQENDEVEPQ
jgi:hypothetical protein